jgi:hypothetical protein
MDEALREFWASIWHFKPEEFAAPEEPASGLKMNFAVVRTLDDLREKSGHPIVVHQNGGFSFRGHCDGSLHYSGRAIDFHFDWPDLMLRQQAMLVFGMGRFCGIGIYPEWNHPGFHVDMRYGPFQVWVKRGEKYLYLF